MASDIVFGVFNPRLEAHSGWGAELGLVNTLSADILIDNWGDGGTLAALDVFNVLLPCLNQIACSLHNLA